MLSSPSPPSTSNVREMISLGENVDNSNPRPTKKSKKELFFTPRQLELLFHQEDIWVGNILPFLGVGQYIFVAGICKHLKTFYGKYFKSIDKEANNKLPLVRHHQYDDDDRKTIATDTFHRTAFASLSCAKLWDETFIKHPNRTNRLGEFIYETIAKYGNVEVLEWAHKERRFSQYLVFSPCAVAAREGHFTVLQYLCENGWPWRDVRTSWYTAMRGNLEILRYLHDKGCPWNQTTTFFAAEFGHLEVLRYLHENGCPWNRGVCIEAAKSGRLDILRYAHENGCPWDEYTCTSAAKSGRLDILHYAHENGCPWDGRTWKAARATGNRAVLKYVTENHCPTEYLESVLYW